VEHQRHSSQPAAQPINQTKLYDDSFVGKSGGDIFHEMMLRHNVQHVFGYPGGAITIPRTSSSFFHDMNKVLDIWLKVTQELQENQALFLSHQVLELPT
jgi:hypothetical protein